LIVLCGVLPKVNFNPHKALKVVRVAHIYHPSYILRQIGPNRVDPSYVESIRLALKETL
jgi:hypothetical protein